VFTKWYNRVCEADSIYPWAAINCTEQPTLLIENLMDIPTTLPILRKFIHKLFFQTTGGNYHIQVLMGSEEDLSINMQMIGWWLKSTYQGMWLMDLQLAKETMCTGWLLFSAGDYDREELSHKIWDFTRVQVAIRFQATEDDKKRDQNAKPDPRTPKPPPPIKVLHVEINKVNQGVNCTCIEALDLSKAMVFPWASK